MTHCNSASHVSLVILAAGLGQRFGGNKQLATIGDSGKPLMYFSVRDAYQQGVRHLVLIVNPQHEQAMVRQFLPQLPADLDVTLVRQDADDLPRSCVLADTGKQHEHPRGTGHALWCAREAVRSSFIVLNADDYYGHAALRRLVLHLGKRRGWAMASYPLGSTLTGAGTVNRGVCEIGDGFLVSVTECRQIAMNRGVIRGEIKGRPLTLDPETPVSMNIWAFDRRIFAALEEGLAVFFSKPGRGPNAEYYLPNQVMRSISRDKTRVRAYRMTDGWLGITYRADLERLTRKLDLTGI